MTILLDPRETATRSLLSHIRQLGRPCEHATLRSGDIHFMGHGPQSPWRVGIERKSVLDLATCMDTGRLTGVQLPRLKEDYDVIYLLIEGGMRRRRTGELEGDLEYCYFDRDWTRPVKPVNYFALTNFITTLEAKAGVNVRRAFSPYDSAVEIVALYDWWTEKTWEEHRAHLAVYTQKRGEIVSPVEAVVRMLTSWKIGVGEKTARRAAQCFPTPLKAALTKESDWGKVEGVGVALAKRIVGVMRGTVKLGQVEKVEKPAPKVFKKILKGRKS